MLSTQTSLKKHVLCQPRGSSANTVEVTYLYWEATYVMLLCVARPTTINLFFLFFFLGFWLFQREFPSRHARRLAQQPL